MKKELNEDDKKCTNQERMYFYGFPLERGYGIRTKFHLINHKPKFLVNSIGIPTHIIHTESFKNKPEVKQETRQQLKEKSRRNQRIKSKLKKR